MREAINPTTKFKRSGAASGRMVNPGALPSQTRRWRGPSHDAPLLLLLVAGRRYRRQGFTPPRPQ